MRVDGYQTSSGSDEGLGSDQVKGNHSLKVRFDGYQKECSSKDSSSSD